MRVDLFLPLALTRELIPLPDELAVIAEHEQLRFFTSNVPDNASPE